MKTFIATWGLFLLAPVAMAATKVRFLAWDNETASKKFSIKSGDNIEEISTLSAFVRTDYFNLKASADTIQIFSHDSLDSAGMPIFFKVNLSPEIENPLVIIISDMGASPQIRTFVIDDSTKRFQWGTSRFLNTTNQPFILRYDDKSYLLNQPWSPLDIPHSSSNKNVEIQLYSNEQSPKLHYSTIWNYENRVRKLVLIIPGSQSRTGSTDLKVVPEYLEDPVISTPP